MIYNNIFDLLVLSHCWLKPKCARLEKTCMKMFEHSLVRAALLPFSKIFRAGRQRAYFHDTDYYKFIGLFINNDNRKGKPVLGLGFDFQPVLAKYKEADSES